MINPVPFIKGENFYCAQACALMALKYYFPDKNFDIEDIAVRSMKHPEFGTTTIGISKALSEYGLHVDFYCKKVEGEELSDVDKKSFLEKYGSWLDKEKEFRTMAIESGVHIIEQDFKIKEILLNLEKGRVVIPLINWKVLCNKEGYQGHFVVLTGYDDKYIYCHNPGPNFPEENANIKIESLERARDYIGTNKETIVVYKD